MKTLTGSIAADIQNSKQKHCLCNTQYFYVVDSDFTSAKHTERIVGLHFQQWLCERATMLRYTYTPYLVNTLRMVRAI